MDHSAFHLCYFIVLSKAQRRGREKPWQSLFNIAPGCMHLLILMYPFMYI